MKVKYKFKTKPDPCQSIALKRALKYGRYGIFFEQRIGKSKVAVDFCGCKFITNQAKIALIVCPMSVMYTWEEQIETHFPYDFKVWYYPKNVNHRNVLLENIISDNSNSFHFLVVNYDKLAVYDRRKFKYTEVERILKFITPDILILDESHLVKSYRSRRHKALYKLAKVVPYRLLLTGTPIPKHWYDIFGQYRIMDDSLFGEKWSDFKNRYCIMGGFEGKEIIGCRDKKEISRIMSTRAIRVLRKHALKELPPEDVIIPVELEPKARGLYNELKRKFITELDKETVVKADFAITRLLRLHQLCGGFLKDDDGIYHQVSKAKLNATIDLVKTIVEGGNQAVLFYKFTQEGLELQKVLEKNKIKFGVINGSIPSEKRHKAIKAFQSKEIDIILIQINSGNMGIKLDSAHLNIFYSMDFSLSNFLQAKDRVMGRDQKHQVTNYYMTIRNSVDSKILKVLQKNQDMANVIANSWAEIFS